MDKLKTKMLWISWRNIFVNDVRIVLPDEIVSMFEIKLEILAKGLPFHFFTWKHPCQVSSIYSQVVQDQVISSEIHVITR